MMAIIVLILLCLIFIHRYQIAVGTLLSGIVIIIFSFFSMLSPVQFFLLEIGGIAILIGGILYFLKKLLKGVKL